MSKDDRYQNQPWYIKLWRRRHYLHIPAETLRIFLSAHIAETDKEYKLSLKTSFDIAKGLAQTKMNWIYDWDEIKAHKAKVG